MEIDINVKNFGAAGNGQNDDTEAIQRAIDAAGKAGGGGVFFPAGTYMVSTLKVPSYVALVGTPSWSYHHGGGTMLKLSDAEVKTMIDLTGSYGARVSGLGLDGDGLGQGICGIYLDGTDHQQEDTVTIENCRIARFSGDGIRFNNIWAFTIKGCMIIFNDGDGFSFTHWDGWIHDNIFNNNKGFGINAKPWNASLTIVNNRIEWNYRGGIAIAAGSHYNINNNYIDRSGGPGIIIQGENGIDSKHERCSSFSITGNVIYRSGAKTALDSYDNCHVRFDYEAGLVFTGNTMTVGKNDSGTGQLSPSYGIVYRSLRNSVLKDNVLHRGATEQLLVDQGDNDETCLVKDNIGSLATGGQDR